MFVNPFYTARRLNDLQLQTTKLLYFTNTNAEQKTPNANENIPCKSICRKFKSRQNYAVRSQDGG